MGTGAVDLALRCGARARGLIFVRFGIRAIGKEAQRCLMHPGSDAIGCRPDLLITNNGAVKCRLLGSAAEVDPRCDAASGWLVLYPAADFGVVKALQDALKV